MIKMYYTMYFICNNYHILADLTYLLLVSCGTLVKKYRFIV